MIKIVSAFFLEESICKIYINNVNILKGEEKCLRF